MIGINIDPKYDRFRRELFVFRKFIRQRKDSYEDKMKKLLDFFNRLYELNIIDDYKVTKKNDNKTVWSVNINNKDCVAVLYMN